MELQHSVWKLIQNSLILQLLWAKRAKFTFRDFQIFSEISKYFQRTLNIFNQRELF